VKIIFLFGKYGFKSEQDFLKANLVILITCGVKQAAEERAYGLINRIIKSNKKAIIAVTGCLSDRSDVRAELKKMLNYF
jgi:tRNA A37 methylthiotransferase MiaB